MQTSGTFGALSDGMRKTMAGCGPSKPAPAKAPKAPKAPAPKPMPAMGGHRRGGYAKHGGK